MPHVRYKTAPVTWKQRSLIEDLSGGCLSPSETMNRLEASELITRLVSIRDQSRADMVAATHVQKPAIKKAKPVVHKPTALNDQSFKALLKEACDLANTVGKRWLETVATVSGSISPDTTGCPGRKHIRVANPASPFAKFILRDQGSHTEVHIYSHYKRRTEPGLHAAITDHVYKFFTSRGITGLRVAHDKP